MLFVVSDSHPLVLVIAWSTHDGDFTYESCSISARPQGSEPSGWPNHVEYHHVDCSVCRCRTSLYVTKDEPCIIARWWLDDSCRIGQATFHIYEHNASLTCHSFWPHALSQGVLSVGYSAVWRRVLVSCGHSHVFKVSHLDSENISFSSRSQCILPRYAQNQSINSTLV